MKSYLLNQALSWRPAPAPAPLTASTGECEVALTLASSNATEESSGFIDIKTCIDGGAHCSASRNKASVSIDPNASASVASCTGPEGECLVFVSTSAMQGNMRVNSGLSATVCDGKDTGLERANCICQTEAKDASYDGSWHAWLSIANPVKFTVHFLNPFLAYTEILF